jgi:DNA polymerase III psi subunit
MNTDFSSSDLVLPNDWQNQSLYVFCDTKKAEKIHTASNPFATIIVFTVGMKPENKEFLDKILQAIKVQTDIHINILEFDHEQGIAISEYLATSTTKKYWWLGTSPKNAGWQTTWQPYKIYTHGGAQHFVSDDLDTIAAKQDLKRTLWQTIQVFFADI